jgi:replicative DNA helicase
MGASFVYHFFTKQRRILVTQLEDTILCNLIHNPEYRDRVLPHLQDDYFVDHKHRWTFKIIREYVARYTKSPTKEILSLELGQRHDIGETECRETRDYINQIEANDQDLPWLIDCTERFC